MGHDHTHGIREGSDTKNIRLAFLLNVSFTIIEIVGGIFTNSVAILSDAVHDLGDSLSLGIAWYFQKMAGKDPDRKFSYGYRRHSILGALINAVVLAVGSSYILWETIQRLYTPETVDPEGMIYLSILGIVVNGAAVFKLRQGDSLNERVVALHLLEDVLGWVAVLIGSLFMLFWDVPILDPLLSICITIYILIGVIRNLRSVLDVILQRVPKNVDLAAIEHYLTSLPGVAKCRDLHVWSLDGNYHVLTVNIIPEESTELTEMLEIKKRIHHDLMEFNVHHSTIEIVR